MAYTVRQLAKMAHVSVRTLHHYDDIGLLRPSFVGENGYRYYEQKELLQLQQILFFRELEFSLQDIAEIMSAPDFNLVEALMEQEKMLRLKRERLDQILITLSQTLTTMKKKKNVEDQSLYDGLSTKKLEEYQEEAKLRWGKTDAWKQSQERLKNWSKDDMKRIQEEGKAILAKIADVMDKGPRDEGVQKLVEEYLQHMNRFYDCSKMMFRNLGTMYSEDERFAAYYEKIAPGLAAFMTEAIHMYCDRS
ncbi:MAG TPA: MerR family transcriptional regulator [Candidatus Gracilibacteria bacterium]|nr:MerR family transcriptional regulator [Candidatus Gracilibacteria bacterium]